MKLIKKIITFTLFSVFLFGADLAELYSSGDTDKLFEELDNKLATVEYWDKKLGNSDYRFGYYTNEKDILVACKECGKLKHFKVEKEKHIALTDLNATFGKYSGDKKREGDLRTPIGVYNFVEKLDKSTNLDPFYGPVAFVTDYPNLLDQKLKKNGSGIWLHGFPLKGDRDPTTKGCIALENDCLEDIASEMKFQNTIILINESHEDLAKRDEILQVISSLYKWRKYWIKNDFDKYISFYGDDFKRADGLGIKNFMKLKKEIFSKNSYTEIYFKDLQITPYPNLENKKIYRIKFLEIYRSNIHKFKGLKELYVELDDNDSFKIILES